MSWGNKAERAQNHAARAGVGVLHAPLVASPPPSAPLTCPRLQARAVPVLDLVGQEQTVEAPRSQEGHWGSRPPCQHEGAPLTGATQQLLNHANEEHSLTVD